MTDDDNLFRRMIRRVAPPQQARDDAAPDAGHEPPPAAPPAAPAGSPEDGIPEIVPFGKYRDRPVTDLIADRGYTQWLCAQPWFRERNRALYELILGVTPAGQTPQDSPEHNAMQVRYIDEGPCRALAAVFLPDRDALVAERDKRLAEATDVQRDNLPVGGEAYTLALSARQFETLNWDVLFAATASLAGPTPLIEVPPDPSECPRCRPTEHHDERCPQRRGYATYSAVEPAACTWCRPAQHLGDCPGGPGWGGLLRNDWCEVMLAVELKPSIADEYPTVLRQVIRRRDLMVARGQWGSTARAVVVTDALRPSSVTPEQVEATFASQGIDLLWPGCGRWTATPTGGA